MSRRKTTSRYHASRKAPAPKIVLSENEQALADVYDEAVGILQGFASLTLAGDAPDETTLSDDFDAITAKAIKMTYGSTALSHIIARGGVAGKVAAAMLTEHTALGIPAWKLDAAGAKVYCVPDRDEYAGVADEIDEIESLSLTDRLELFVDDGASAAVAFGALLGRDGLGNLMFDSPWSAESVGPSLFGAALASAVLARIPAAMGPDYYGLTDADPAAAAALTRAAGDAYDAIDDGDRYEVKGHGTTSLVIENLLFDIEWDDRFGERDLRRLSLLLATAFVGGRNGVARPVSDDNALCQAFFDAAAAIGRETMPGAAVLAPRIAALMTAPSASALPN